MKTDIAHQVLSLPYINAPRQSYDTNPLLKMIADIDTNVVLFSEWLEKDAKYAGFFGRLKQMLDGLGIQWAILPKTQDIWARDYMPIQLAENDFVGFRYQPDYLMCRKPGECYLTDSAAVCRAMGMACRPLDVNMDGGNFVFCGDCVVMTDKVFEENRCGKNDPDLIRKLETAFGCPVVFIPWTRHGAPCDEEVDVYGHADGFIKWCGGKRLLMSNHRDEYPAEADAIREVLENKGFEVVEMRFDTGHPDADVNWAYINFLQVGHHILMPSFGIPEDEQAMACIGRLFPDCDIHPLEMRCVAEDGGALHCISWNIAAHLSDKESDIVRMLQDQMKVGLGRGIHFRVGDVDIYPLTVEAYYYDEGVFEDLSVHRNERQQNNPNHLYIHRKGTSARNKPMFRAGVDWVWSDGEGIYHTWLLRRVRLVKDGGEEVCVDGIMKVLAAVRKWTGLSDAELESASWKVLYDEGDSISVSFDVRLNLGQTHPRFRYACLRGNVADC